MTVFMTIFMTVIHDSIHDSIHDRIHHSIHDSIHDRIHDSIHDSIHDRFHDSILLSCCHVGMLACWQCSVDVKCRNNVYSLKKTRTGKTSFHDYHNDDVYGDNNKSKVQSAKKKSVIRISKLCLLNLFFHKVHYERMIRWTILILGR